MYEKSNDPPDPKLERLLSLLAQCEEVATFELEGRMFLGYKPEVIKAFIKANPLPVDFSVWVQQHYRELK